MPVNKSLETYRQRQGNCAQSILIGFQETHNVSDDHIAEAKAHGGGRAEGGRCGALHSALKLEQDPKKREALQVAFQEKAGAETCRDIRNLKKLDCAGCVELAARHLADDHDR